MREPLHHQQLRRGRTPCPVHQVRPQHRLQVQYITVQYSAVQYRVQGGEPEGQVQLQAGVERLGMVADWCLPQGGR